MNDQTKRLIELLTAALGTGLLLWAEAPEWQRKQMAMTIARYAARLAGRPHRAAGRAGIAAEARAGREEAGILPYSLARYLGQVREYARAAYERLGA